MHNSFNSLEHLLKLSATSVCIHSFVWRGGCEGRPASCWQSLQGFSACGFCLVYVAFLSVVAVAAVVVRVFSLGSK